MKIISKENNERKKAMKMAKIMIINKWNKWQMAAIIQWRREEIICKMTKVINNNGSSEIEIFENCVRRKQINNERKYQSNNQWK